MEPIEVDYFFFSQVCEMYSVPFWLSDVTKTLLLTFVEYPEHS